MWNYRYIDNRRVRYTGHARERMEKRNITEEDILDVLNNADEMRPGDHSNETIATKNFGRKRVRVIYVSEPDEIRIITVTN